MPYDLNGNRLLVYQDYNGNDVYEPQSVRDQYYRMVNAPDGTKYWRIGTPEWNGNGTISNGVFNYQGLQIPVTTGLSGQWSDENGPINVSPTDQFIPYDSAKYIAEKYGSQGGDAFTSFLDKGGGLALAALPVGYAAMTAGAAGAGGGGLVGGGLSASANPLGTLGSEFLSNGLGGTLTGPGLAATNAAGGALTGGLAGFVPAAGGATFLESLKTGLDALGKANTISSLMSGGNQSAGQGALTQSSGPSLSGGRTASTANTGQGSLAMPSSNPAGTALALGEASKVDPAASPANIFGGYGLGPSGGLSTMQGILSRNGYGALYG